MKNLLALFLFYPLILFSQEKVTWDYPIKPGSEEWCKIDNYFDRLELLNIPENILENITTKELVALCLQYPQMELAFTRNSSIEGISFLASMFNGFAELLSRADAGNELFEYYKKMGASQYSVLDKTEKVKHKMDFIIIELALSSPAVLTNMESKNRLELLKDTYKKYEEKSINWKKFYFEQISPNLLIMARIIEIDRPELKTRAGIKDGIDPFLKTGITHNPIFITNLTKQVSTFLKD